MKHKPLAEGEIRYCARCESEMTLKDWAVYPECEPCQDAEIAKENQLRSETLTCSKCGEVYHKSSIAIKSKRKALCTNCLQSANPMQPHTPVPKFLKNVIVK